MLDINLETLENLDLVNQGSLQNNSTSNAPKSAKLNLLEERILQQQFLENIIAEVNNVGVSIIPRKKTKGCPVIYYWGEFCCFCS